MSYDRDLEKRILTRLAVREDEPELDDTAFALVWEAAPEAFGMPHDTAADLSESWETLLAQLEEMQRRRLVSGTVYVNRISELKLEYRGYAALRGGMEDVFREDHARVMAGYEKLRRDNDELRTELDVLRREMGFVQTGQDGLRNDVAAAAKGPGWGRMIVPAVVLPVLVTVLAIVAVHYSGVM